MSQPEPDFSLMTGKEYLEFKLRLLWARLLRLRMKRRYNVQELKHKRMIAGIQSFDRAGRGAVSAAITIDKHLTRLEEMVKTVERRTADAENFDQTGT